MTVTAQDSGTPPASNSTSIVVTVADANDNDPEFQNADRTISWPESVKPSTVLAMLNVSDDDIGVNAQLSAALTSGDTSLFRADIVDNSQVAITLTGNLDFETATSHSMTI